MQEPGRAQRRRLIAALGGAAATLAASRVLAAALQPTPRQTAGPFYPDRLPLDMDNDLVRVGGAQTQALGDLTWVSGRVLDVSGRPMRNALVEIWQVDRNGVYLHTQSAGRERRDSNFQGYGRCLSGEGGEYQFRTIKPVPYGWRTAHIHFAVQADNAERFTTQLYVKGEAKNAEDGVLNAIRDPAARDAVIVDFLPVAGRRGELAARFDIVLGVTPRA
jgi:protocatechuate 3,4-dioxygenase, beta subunit